MITALEPSFKQQSISTSLGEMVYVTDKDSFWRDQAKDLDTKLTIGLIRKYLNLLQPLAYI